jgi:aminoglycoside 3-N-acetyltransferase
MTNYDYTKEDIVKALKQVGLVKGDNIFIHSNIGFFGKLEGCTDKDSYCKVFKESILDVIGSEGTLIVPTFSYSFCNQQIFDKSKTESKMGIFAEYIRNDPNSLRSDDANFSVAAIGKNAKKFTENMPMHTFGEDSFWERFLKSDGKICNFNLDSASTFIHYVERLLKVPYRFDKPFSGISIIDRKEIQKTYYHFARDLTKPENEPDFTKFDKKAKESKLVKSSNLGKGQIVCITAKDIFELIKKEITTTPNFLTKGSNF